MSNRTHLIIHDVTTGEDLVPGDNGYVKVFNVTLSANGGDATAQIYAGGAERLDLRAKSGDSSGAKLSGAIIKSATCVVSTNGLLTVEYQNVKQFTGVPPMLDAGATT